MDLTRINTLSDLEQLLELLGRYDINEFEIESEQLKLRLAKSRAPDGAGPVTFLTGAPGMTVGPQAASPAEGRDGVGAGDPGRTEEALPAGVKAITSPMVGTFYRAPSPEADPFVDVGDRVESDSVLCIIEAMKVMNEIPAGQSGVIKDILVTNGESVEFGQPLFHVATD